MSNTTMQERRVIRSSAVLTDAYVAGNIIENANRAEKLQILASYTKGSNTSCEIKVEFSNDKTTYYQESYTPDPTAGVSLQQLWVHQLDTTGNYSFIIPTDVRYIKISAKCTGTVTNSLLAIEATIR